MGVFLVQLQVPSMWIVIIINWFWDFYFISFSNTLNKRKRNPPGFIFQLFSDSQKLKRLSTTYHFELVRVNESMSPKYTFTPFSSWEWLFTKMVRLGRHGQEMPSDIIFYLFRFEGQITKRGMMEFSFHFFFRLSKYEKNTKLLLPRARKTY